MFLFYYSKDNIDFKEFDLSKHNEYEKFTFDVEEKKYSINTLLNMKKIKIKYLKDDTLHTNQEKYTIDNNIFTIQVNSHIDNEVTQFLLFKAKKYFTSIEVSKKGKVKTIIISKEKQKNPYIKNEYENIIKSLSKHLGFANRVFLPCMIENYNYLRLKYNSSIPWVHNHDSIYSLSYMLYMPKMLSPFIIKDDKKVVVVNDKLINWVYDNRYDSNTSIENIKESYEKFIEEYKQL